MPNSRELLLQNLLAQAAGLLYRYSRSLPQTSDEKWLILIEIEEFFSETKKSLSAELSREVSGASPTPAKSAVTNGAELFSVKKTPKTGF